MIRLLIVAGLLLAAIPAMASAQAGIDRAARALDAPALPYVDPGPVYIDPGPRDAKLGGTFLIRLLPAYRVRAICPAAIDWHSIGCTLLPSRVVIMPDEESSGLPTEQWLRALRHEMLHAMGLDFHGLRP